jgi:hypothetical protein
MKGKFNMSEKITGNREYKDSIFRLLFDDEAKSIELYNAIKGTEYKADTVKMNTLENPFFFGEFRNDLSFTVEDKLIILIEHQSSVSPNIGLRFLMYVADLYEISINQKELYRAAPMSIASPEFYVIYNGKESYPEKSTVKLSDLFKVQGMENALELTVTVYNANKGYNKTIMKRSKTLDEYAEFIAKVRYYVDRSGLSLTEALKKAIEDCVRENILREFLMKHGGYVMNALTRGLNWEEALELRLEEREEKIAGEMAEKMAKKMLLDNEPIEKIVKYTELTEEQVLELKNKIAEK